MILGSGWAAARLLRDINSSLYDYTVQAPTSHAYPCYTTILDLHHHSGPAVICPAMVNM